MKNDITRRDALALGVSAAALAATGTSARADIKVADVPAPALPIEKGASLAHAAAGPVRAGRRRRVPRQRRQIHRKDRRRGQGRLRRLGRHQPADRGDVQLAAPVPTSSSASATRRTSMSTSWSNSPTSPTISASATAAGWRWRRSTARRARATRGSDCRSAPAAAHWSIASRSANRSASTGFRKTMPASRPLQEAAGGRQAGGLRTRQRRRRRQRLCKLAIVVAQRFAAR